MGVFSRHVLTQVSGISGQEVVDRLICEHIVRAVEQIWMYHKLKIASRIPYNVCTKSYVVHGKSLQVVRNTEEVLPRQNSLIGCLRY